MTEDNTPVSDDEDVDAASHAEDEPAPKTKGRKKKSAPEDGNKTGKPAKKKRKPMSTAKKIVLGVVAFLSLIIFYGLQPLVGTPRYGACRTFIELQLPYPGTLQINYVDESATAVRVYYAYIDAFGSSKMNMIECEFRNDPRHGLVFSNVMVNRQPVAREQIDSFNATMSYVLQNPPDLRLPKFRSDSLRDLKIDYN